MMGVAARVSRLEVIAYAQAKGWMIELVLELVNILDNVLCQTQN